MTIEDYQKRLMDMMVQATESGMSDPTELLGEIAGLADEVQNSGLLPEGALDEPLAQLQQLSAITAGLSAAQEAGDSKALERIARESAAISGVPLPEDEPEIFDAIEAGDIERVKEALITWDVNERYGEFGKTALYSAMSTHWEFSLDICHLLLDAGADPCMGLTQTNVLGGLGFAVFGTPVAPEDLAKLIVRCVELGADLEQRSDRLQWTPLHLALDELNSIAVEALLIAGANPNARVAENNGSCTAGQSCLSMSTDHPELFALLLNYGADPELKNTQGLTVAEEIDQELLREADSDYPEFYERLRECRKILSE